MKKKISVFIIAVMLVSSFTINISAASYNEFPVAENRYYDRILEYNYEMEPSIYRELHHYNNESDDEPDWTLITYIVVSEPWMVKYGALVNDRVIWSMAGTGFGEFSSTGYAVYLPEKDIFIGLINDNIEQIIEQCPEFVETLEEFDIGQRIGDVNEDNIVNILDATYIQRELALYYDFITRIRTVVFGEFKYFSISDFDRDGEVSILDATAIQRKLARLDVPVATTDEV